jgi:phosphatidylinositol glycan class B
VDSRRRPALSGLSCRADPPQHLAGTAPESSQALARGQRLDRLCAAGAAIFIAGLAALRSGSVHPDEIFQFLEPANRLAFGFGFLTWEWQEGLRNWAVPGALAAGMKLADLVGGTTPFAHRLGVAVVVALLSYPGLNAIVAYARRRTSSLAAARLALALVLGSATSLYFLGRTLGEPLGALACMAAFGALDPLHADDRRWGPGLQAGLWLGVAVVIRYGFASVVPIALLQLLLERRLRTLALVAASGAATALALGALDWATWGTPWQSLLSYTNFNLGAGAPDRFGSQPWWFYFEVLVSWAPWPLFLGLPWFRLRADRLSLPALAYFVALCLASHKEERCVFPVILLLTVAWAIPAADGLVSGWQRGTRRQLALGAWALTELGWTIWTDARLPDLDSDLFRATMQVATDPGLRELVVVNASRWESGGSFYMGRDVPTHYIPHRHARRNPRAQRRMLQDPAVNRALVFRSPEDQATFEGHGFRQIGAIGGTTILAR